MPRTPKSKLSQLPSAESLAKLLVAEVRDYAIFILDPHNPIRMWNAGSQNLLKFREKEVIGHQGSIIFTPEDIAAGEHIKELRVARRDGRAINERWHVRKDKSRFWGSGMMIRLTGDDGKIIGFAKIMRDRTEQKQLLDQVSALNQSLEQRVAERTAELLDQQQRLRSLALELSNAEQRARDVLAADLHDNLAQTLAVCRMKLGTAGAAYGDHRPPAFNEAVACIEDVLRMTRTMMYSLSPMMLAGGEVRSAIDWVQQQMASHGLQVRTSDDGKPKPLDEDMLRLLYRAVQELLWNVVKHARTNRAHVAVKRAGNAVQVIVTDRGRGFSSKRLGQATDTGGFGLFSLRERLKALGGSVQITSARGKGTRVVVEVPARGN